VENLANLKELCQKIVMYAKNGDPVHDVIEQSPYSESELIYELALDYLASHPNTSSY
jgi:hypothetical protein